MVVTYAQAVGPSVKVRFGLKKQLETVFGHARTYVVSFAVFYRARKPLFIQTGILKPTLPTMDANTGSCVMNGKKRDRVPVLSA